MFDIDVEIFIYEVEKRPALYNPNIPEYSDREMKMKLWNEIADQTLPDWNQYTGVKKHEIIKKLIQKWKSLRDSYVKQKKFLKQKEYIPMPKKKRQYAHFEALTFLDDIVNQSLNKKNNENQNSDNASNNNIGNSDNGYDQEPNSLSIVAHKLSQIWAQTLELHNKEEDIHGNRAFLQSYVPIMNKLPPTLMMEARLRITDLFKDLAFACGFENTSPIVNNDGTT